MVQGHRGGTGATDPVFVNPAIEIQGRSGDYGSEDWRGTGGEQHFNEAVRELEKAQEHAEISWENRHTRAYRCAFNGKNVEYEDIARILPELIKEHFTQGEDTMDSQKVYVRKVVDKAKMFDCPGIAGSMGQAGGGCVSAQPQCLSYHRLTRVPINQKPWRPETGKHL